jgi:membrane fusion protein, heavy metal efflux system
MNNPHKLYSSFFLILFVFLDSCTGNSSKEQPKEQPAVSSEVVLTDIQIKNAGIRLGSVSERELSTIIRANGMLDVPPQNLVSVSAMASGYVKSTDMLQGLHVHNGDPLCVLENPDYLTLQQEYLSNFSRIPFLQKEFNRQAELAKENVASAKEAEQSEAELNSLKNTQKGLAARLEMFGFDVKDIEKGNLRSQIVVRSNIDGYITKVGINLGSFVQPNDLLCEIVNLDHIHAELMVYEKDLSSIAVGQRLEFTLTGNQEKVYHASVYLINRKINSDRTVQVHAHIEDADKGLIPNMQLTASIRTKGRKVRALPTAAIVTQGKANVIYIQKAGTRSFSSIPIKTGIQEGDWTEVNFPGIEKPESLSIVLQGAYDLKAMAENKGEED